MSKFTVLNGKPVFKAQQGDTCTVLETGEQFCYVLPYGWVKEANMPIEHVDAPVKKKAPAKKKRSKKTPSTAE